MLADRILRGSSSSLSSSCPSLGSELIAVARTHLWSSLSRCSASVGILGRNPLSSRTPKTKVFCFSTGPDFSPDTLPASRGALAPFRLCSRSPPQSSPWDLTSEAQASAPTPHLPRRVSRLVSAGRHQSFVWESLHFALCTAFPSWL